MLTKKFQRKIEDFACEQCGFEVHGTGYTNHCPHCLWSKHVDVNPGDRAATCRGRMEPFAKELKRGVWIITHRCVECGHTKPNECSPEDNFDALIGM